jgi:SAM-dependent methyltransferase
MLKRIIESLNRFRGRADLEKDAGSYWGLSDSDERVQDQSHWCGVMRWSRNRWFEYGDFHLRLILKYLEKFAGPDYAGSLSAKTAMEWGCGGGSIVRPLCQKFTRVYGVDISRASLEECTGQMKTCGLPNFLPVFFHAQDPESVLHGVTAGSVDVIVSAGVFQHFPSKPYTQRVISVMGQLIKPGGFALIQIRYFDGSSKLRQKESDYAQNVIYMTSFAPEEFSPLLEEAGFILLQRARDPDGGGACHDYYFARKK